MSDFINKWRTTSAGSKFGLISGVILILAMMAYLSYSILKVDYQVLFADLNPQDAAAMVAELDQLKVPYRLSQGGSTIQVPAEQVYKTRLQLTGKEIPLRGAVGFELFNNNEMGISEFTQKINFQRALQGELTRTIGALDEVQSVRVHLVLAEHGLFKKTQTQSKASVTLTLKPGKALSAAQISGIQRLVAAAVPEIKAEDVTLVDNHGLALTRKKNELNHELSLDGSALEEKKALERYLGQKVTEVLTQACGEGQALASIDVVLDTEHKRVTTESPVGNTADAKTGMILREKHNANASNRLPKGDINPALAAPESSENLREVEYQLGRKVEQLIPLAAAIQQLKVAVVLKTRTDSLEQDKLRELIATAAGIDKKRGDLVTIYSVDQLPASASDQLKAIELARQEQAKEQPVVNATPKLNNESTYLVIAILALIMVAVSLLTWLFRKPAQTVAPLTTQERQQVLLQIQTWLHDDRRPQS